MRFVYYEVLCVSRLQSLDSEIQEIKISQQLICFQELKAINISIIVN